MTTVELHNALERFLEQSVKDIRVKYTDNNNEEQLIPFTIVTAWILPQEQTKDSSKNTCEYAHVAPRITKVNSTSEKSTVEIKITIGIQSSEYINLYGCAGYMDILNIMERIKQDLLKARVLDKKFLIDDSIVCEITDEQAYPFLRGEMKITGTLPGTVEEGVNL